jgi:hypothetical protein
LRILFDKNVPVGVRRFLSAHDVRTFNYTGWPVQLENGALLAAAEEAGFDVLVTSDQNIRYQQNLGGRKIALLVLGSNIWPIVCNYAEEIAAKASGTVPGGYEFIEMPLQPRQRR